MWTPIQLVYAVLMVVSGSLNTLVVKKADMIESENSNGTVVEFNHPFLQAGFMFLGESLCMVVFLLTIAYRLYCHKDDYENNEGPKCLSQDVESKEFEKEKESCSMLRYLFTQFKLFYFPALCDVTATSIMYIALTLTSASSFQMLRGSIMIFVGLESVIFLKKKLEWWRWLGMFIILIGLIIVGVSDVIYPSDLTSDGGDHEQILDGIPDEVLGDILVVAAQVVAGTQFVYEEAFIKKHNIPALKVVGWEGIFGVITLSIAMIPMNFIVVGPDWGHNPREVLEDPIDGLTRIINSAPLMGALALTMISIAFFNFAGVSITRELGATNRKVLDSLRTLVIWAVSLAVGWQAFFWLQPVGFVVLVAGMFVYNDILFIPMIRKHTNVIPDGW